MAALASFAELADGTEVTVGQPGEGMARWTYRDNRLHRDDHTLDPWLFTGLLAEGKVFLADTRPAQRGDWFANQYPHHHEFSLVVEVDGNRATCARFDRYGGFVEWETHVDITDTHTRTECPWEMATVALSMARLAHTDHQRMVKAETQVQRYRRNRADLNTALTYLRQIEERMADE